MTVHEFIFESRAGSALKKQRIRILELENGRFLLEENYTWVSGESAYYPRVSPIISINEDNLTYKSIGELLRKIPKKYKEYKLNKELIKELNKKELEEVYL